MKLFLFFTILYSSALLKAQETLTLIEKTPLLEATFIGVDSYGYTYFIKDQVLNKKNKEQTFVFQDFQLGEISSVDILNPLKIMVFYKEANTAVILDNTLAPIKRIHFNQLPEIIEPQTISTANDNRLWLFNTNTQQLELFNYIKSQNRVLSLPLSESIIGLKGNFNYCFLQSENSILMFSVFGSLIKTLPLSGIINFTLSHTHIVIQTTDGFFIMTDRLENLSPLNLLKTNVAQFHLIDDFLYIYDGNFISQYLLNNQKH